MDFSYDADGNITSDGVHTNTWDALNRLAQVQDFSAGSAMQFAYAPSGARYQEMTTIGAATTTFIEVNALFEVEYSSATGHTTYRASIMGGTGVVAIRTVRDDGVLTTRYVTGNHLGGVSVISDEVGTVDERMSYGAFGERRDPATWQPYTNPPDLTNITDKGYTGQQQLDAVRLVHMNGRVYDPEIGRFMSADPIVPDPLDGQSFARYAYVGNNPLSAIDPSGFDDLPPGYQLVFCTYVCGVSPEPQLAPLPPFNPAVDSFNPPALAQMPALLMSTMVPPSTPAVSGPQPIPTGSGNSGSTGSGNYNPGNFGSGNFLLPIDTPCQYGSNCGGNNGVQQAMNDTNGVQDVSWGDIDWGSMGGSGKLHAPPGPVEIPGPNGHYIGGPAAGPSRSPGSVGVTIGATTDAVPWGTAIASGLDTLLLKAASVIGLALKLSGDTPNQRYFRHYTSDTNPGDFARGLNAGSYATTGYGPVMTPKQAQMSLSLKVTPTVYYDVTIYSGDIPIEGPSRVPANFGQPGGGLEFIFPQGTPAGSITGPFPLPGGG